MTITDIAEKYSLTDEEKLIFNEYTLNRFAGAKEIEAPDTSFLELWNRILYYAELFGADKAINDKVCPNRPIKFRSPGTLEIKIVSIVRRENTDHLCPRHSRF